MVHLRGENNWVERPQHCRWGFEKPRPELLKISIDLRPKFHEQTKQAPLARSIDPDLSSILAENKKKSRASNSQQLAKAGGLFVWCSLTSFCKVLRRFSKKKIDSLKAHPTPNSIISLEVGKRSKPKMHTLVGLFSTSPNSGGDPHSTQEHVVT